MKGYLTARIVLRTSRHAQARERFARRLAQDSTTHPALRMQMRHTVNNALNDLRNFSHDLSGGSSCWEVSQAIQYIYLP